MTVVKPKGHPENDFHLFRFSLSHTTEFKIKSIDVVKGFRKCVKKLTLEKTIKK